MAYVLYYTLFSSYLMGFSGGSEVKASPWNAGDPSSIPGSERFPWKRKWQPTSVLLPGESHSGRSLVGPSPWGHKELDTTEQFHFSSLFSSYLIINIITVQFSSVQLSRSVMSDSLRPHESQHTRPPCPSPSPGVHSNSCPLSR